MAGKTASKSKKTGGKSAKSKSRKKGTGKKGGNRGNAWRSYVGGGSNEPIPW